MKKIIALCLLLIPSIGLCVPESAPDRERGEGPFDRLVLRGVMVVSGEGAPPVGPMDVLVEGNRIARIQS
ncbi:MAG: amidohydrolase, partial [Xanthomonadales bacterium]|nr:amidohydrolase [Xanthomonadales bacterium]NIX11975.1 amidohydrolase [Xanthomonadales bacterium]